MPRSGLGVYDVPAGTTATPNTTILSAAYNAFIADLIADLNAARPVTAGGTGGTSVITGWDGLAAKGTDIASASSINLTTATGPSVTITGTATIASVTLAEGSFRIVRAGGAFTWDASSSLLVNGSSTTDVTAAANDLFLVRGGASSVVSVVGLGSATVPAATTSAAGIVELATAAEALTGTDATRAVTPAGLYFPTGHLYGLTLSNNGSDATNDIDIAAGTARDSTDSANMVLASALTKRLDASWAVGTGNGGLDTGSIADTTYHVWLIKRSDTGVVDALFSTSASSPTMPSNYDYKRRIGSVVRASAAIRAFVQDGDEFRLNSAGVQEYSGSSRSKAALTCAGLPTGVRVKGIFNARVQAASGDASGTISVFDGANSSIGEKSSIYVNVASAKFSDAVLYAYSNTSAQIQLHVDLSTGTTGNVLTTLGWFDTRGRT